MLYKKAVTFFLILSTFISCKNKAVEYNNELVKIQKSILPEVEAFAKKMEQTSTGSITLKDLESEAKDMVTLLDKKMAEATEVSVPEGGQELKYAIMEQLKFERDICYKTGKLGNEETSQEEKNIITQEFMNSEAEAQKLEERIAQAQKRYAEKNNFKLNKK